MDSLFKLSPGLFPTMEDYIWVKLSLVNTSPTAAGASGIGGGSNSWGGVSGSFSPSSGGALGSAAPGWLLVLVQVNLATLVPVALMSSAAVTEGVLK